MPLGTGVRTEAIHAVCVFLGQGAFQWFSLLKHHPSHHSTQFVEMAFRAFPNNKARSGKPTAFCWFTTVLQPALQLGLLPQRIQQLAMCWCGSRPLDDLVALSNLQRQFTVIYASRGAMSLGSSISKPRTVAS